MNVSQFKKLVSMAEPFLMQSDFIPILQHIWIHPHYIIAFNDIQAIQLEYKSTLHCAVPGKILVKLLGTINQEDINIEQVQDKLLIGSGKNQTKLPILPPEEFVFAFPDPVGIEVTLEPTTTEGMEKCLLTVSHDPTRPERNGITFKVTNDSLTMFVTDGKTISRFVTEGKFRVAATEEMWVILPTFFCDQLCKMIKEQKIAATLYFTEGSVIATIGNNKMFSRLINAKPPQYENAIAQSVPDLDKIQLVDTPDSLIPALERAMLMIYPEKGINSTSITLEQSGQLTLHTESDRGRAHDSIDTDIKGNSDIEMVVEPSLLQRAVNSCSQVTIRKNAWVFTTKDRSFAHLISIKAA